MLLAAYWIGLFVLTHLPGYPMPYHPTLTDKVGHGGGFALLSLLLAYVVWRVTRRFTYSGLVAIGAVLALYGACDELTQPYVGRSCDFFDWLADVGGIVLGLATWTLIANFIYRHQPAESSQ